MGFNGVRKHQKIEDPRYLYWADALGLAVWEEMPSAYRFTPHSVERLSREWTAVIARDYSHPCIIAWVPINESWGVPNLPDNPRERHYVQALYHLTQDARSDAAGDRQRRLGKRRHRHHRHPRLRRSARADRASATAPTKCCRGCSSASARRPAAGARRAAARRPAADAHRVRRHRAVARRPTARGATRVARRRRSSPRRYARAARRSSAISQLLAGFCYTQFTDTYQEANGLLYADRTPKIPLERIAAATAGPRRRASRRPRADRRSRRDADEVP